MIEVVFDDRETTRYLEEILSHAGMPWRQVFPDDLNARPPSPSIIVLAGRGTANASLREWLAETIQAGGALITCGGNWGLGDLLGARDEGCSSEGYLSVDLHHPVTANLASSLHVFEAAALHAAGGTSLGTLLDASRRESVGDAVVINRVGHGVTVSIAADIPAAVYRIQHGAPVCEDGLPAPDGTAPIDDGILKCDDGIVLSWSSDRERSASAAPEPDCPGNHPDFPLGDTPWFARPVADDLRALLIQAIGWATAEAGLPLPFISPWPRHLPAVGLISHDSDFNIDATARATLRQLEEADIHSTWCMMEGPAYPDRYSAETFALVRQAGHETALHYNALDRDGGRWGREELLVQADWLRVTTGGARVSSNKNHFTRWEGTVECFRWLEDAGIACDQSKGPSKKGNVGYPFGSCQPWYPLDTEQVRFVDVLEIPLQTQDLWLTTPFAVAGPIIDAAVRHQGVAHFLFHQVHLERWSEVADAMQRVIADGRARGLEWWTSEQINDWERLRRSITLNLQPVSDGRWRLIVESPVPAMGFCAAVVLPTGASERLVTAVISSGASIQTSRGMMHNLGSLLLEWDLAAGSTTVDIVIK